MSLEKQQNFLARLFTDESLRRKFLSGPARVGAEHDLSAKEIEDIEAILPEEINFFAETLFRKRLHEVEKLLPLTNKILAAEFETVFREFSQNFNPQTLKKHLEDAIEFGKFLQKREISDPAKSAARFERAKLEFFGYGRRFTVCRLDFDIREISAQNQEPPKKTKIAVWFRLGTGIKHFIL